LVRHQSSFGVEPGPEALAGGLIEFTSHLHSRALANEFPQLRVWYEEISDLFKDQPRFEIVVKVFDVMVRYKESGDERRLLEFPLEQGTLLSHPGKSTAN
jgi:hypothetical protein